ncbi:MAG TPA: biotin synthase BioB [Desulfobacterales bacterium]|nr:biotin synthase BioB [Desulfobacterales bacterium]
MDKMEIIHLARSLLEGKEIGEHTLRQMALMPEAKVFDLMIGANLLREAYFENKIQLCTICNAKSGKCSEDCAFCSQSAFSSSHITIYPLEPKRIKAGAREASKGPVARYSVVTSGKRLTKKEVKTVADTLTSIGHIHLEFCASLGTLGFDDLVLLKEAGITRYHHNLEASRSFYPQVCTTHCYDERLQTVEAARQAGLTVCSGGLFGMGESDLQILELALALKELDVDAVPINFLTPIPGTRLEKANYLTPLKCLKIISLFRFVLPRKEIIICGGREANLKELHPLVFYAGASGIMTGNYLTTKGRTLEKDLALLDQLGLEPISPAPGKLRPA